MKPEVTLKYLSFLHHKKQNEQQGFTLIELLVVVIIIGVLAAVALPNLLGQVGKARETEIKNAVGTINRMQQSYHFERTLFAPNQSTLGVTIPTSYIQDIDGAMDVTAGVVAEFNPLTQDDSGTLGVALGIRSYGGAIMFDDGVYEQIMCRSLEPSDTALSVGLVNLIGDCNPGEEVK